MLYHRERVCQYGEHGSTYVLTGKSLLSQLSDVTGGGPSYSIYQPIGNEAI